MITISIGNLTKNYEWKQTLIYNKAMKKPKH